MDTRAPDWHLFRAFLAVMQEGSLSRAARVLGTTQPTMGRQIAALEASLATTLFTRSLDGLAPTQTALRLLPAAEAMAAAVEAAQRSVSGETDEARGTIRLTASVVFGVEILPSILADFHRLHPGITVELALSNRNDDLLRGEADIAVRMIRPVQTSLIAKRIGRVDIGLYGHQRYLDGHNRPLQLQDLSHHTLIGFDRDQAHATMVERMGVPLNRDGFAFRSDSELAQLTALRAGFGIGACQLGIAKRDGNLIPLLHSELIVSMDVWIAMHPDLRTSRRIRLMFDHVALELNRYAQTSRHEVS